MRRATAAEGGLPVLEPTSSQSLLTVAGELDRRASRTALTSSSRDGGRPAAGRRQRPGRVLAPVVDRGNEIRRTVGSRRCRRSRRTPCAVPRSA